MYIRNSSPKLNVVKSEAKQARVFLTFVVVTYKRDLHLRAFLSALACQTDLGFDLVVIHDGPSRTAGETVRKFQRDFLGSVRYLETSTRHNDYGHTLREIGLQITDTEYVLISNDDNYYAPLLVETLRNELDTSNAKLALLDLIHSYPDVYTNRAHIFWVKVLDKLKKHGVVLNIGRKSAYSPVHVKPRRGMVDIGSMVVLSSLAKSVGFPWRDYDADGQFAEAIMRRVNSRDVIKIPGIFFVHN